MTASTKAHVPVSFKKRGGAYRGSVPLKHLALLQNDPAATMSTATDIYISALREIRDWQIQARELRSCQKALPAWKAWELGDIVNRMKANLAEQGCRLEGVYDHLQRHAGLSPSSLSKFVTLRRHVKDSGNIPYELRWNRIRDAAKSFGQSISEKYDGSPETWTDANDQRSFNFASKNDLDRGRKNEELSN